VLPSVKSNSPPELAVVADSRRTLAATLDGTELEVAQQDAEDTTGTKFGAWAGYDPRVERNARGRVQNLDLAVERLLNPTSPKSQIFAATTVVLLAEFSRMDFERLSYYPSDETTGVVLDMLEGIHSYVNGGAAYNIPSHSNPLLEELLPLELSPGDGLEESVVSRVLEVYGDAKQLLSNYVN